MTLDPSSPYYADFLTNHGSFRVKLFPAQVPVTVNNFVVLARQGYYDGLIFHRVIEDFMVQGGDPTGTGTGGPGYQFDDEIVPGLVFDSPGKLAMANAGPDTNGSQLFITVAPTEWLNGSHTIFGEVIEGQDVVDFISRVATGRADRPLEPVTMETVTILTSALDPPPSPSSEDRSSLSSYATDHAGGPGAIYVGDLTQLAGPAVIEDFMQEFGAVLGDDDGNVPLSAIEQFRWIFESDYYQSLLDKARLTNPTPLTSSGDNIQIHYACLNRKLLWCKHLEAYFVPNVRERTSGQITIRITSLPEHTLSGEDTAVLIRDGTFEMSEIYSGHVSTDLPVLSLGNMFGMWPDHQTHFQALSGIITHLDQLLAEATGTKVLMRNWIGGDDWFLFSNKRLEHPNDFRNLKTHTFSTDHYGWLYGMGADAQAVPSFIESYVAFERSVLDASLISAGMAYSQSWHQIAKYMSGPLYSFDSTVNAVNKEVWDGLPEDVQHILIEEGAKHELEALRLTGIHNITSTQRNIKAGLELVRFSPELRELSFRATWATWRSLIPGWLRMLEYPGRNEDAVALFNEHVGPYVGLRIEPDGRVVSTSITQGPHAGKTMEQVLAE